MQLNSLKDTENHIVFDKDCDLIEEINEEKSLNFLLKRNTFVSILIESKASLNIDFIIEDGAYLKISILNKENKNEYVITGNVKKDATFAGVFADFACNATNVKTDIDLVEENASGECILSLTSNERFKKLYDINFNHLNKFTFSKLKGFGVALKESEIKVIGTSYIKKDCIKSNASQDVKIILFDKTSRGLASPILKIDCDDIKANHACSIGSINDEHLYYLLSRGIELKTVRQLIVLGYILPIKDYFKDKEKEYINEYIRKDFSYA